MASLRRLLVAGAAALAAGAAAAPVHAAVPAAAHTLSWPAATAKGHVMPRIGSTASGVSGTGRAGTDALTGGSGNLTYHNGAVQDQPRLYLDFWGLNWTTNTPDMGGVFTGNEGQTYITTFANDIAGSAWLTSQTQYCEGAIGLGSDISRCPGSTHVGLTGAVSGVFNDTTSTPPSNTMVRADVEAEVDRAAAHFGLFQDVNATILVFTPSGQSVFSFPEPGFSGFCGYHLATNTAIYAYVPWVPDAGSGCHTNEVNASNDSFGHGHFDGFSITTGHEIAEVMTDPFPGAVDQNNNPVSGWSDVQGFETGDKCSRLTAWPERDLTFPSNFFAVQPLWSDAGATCALEDVGGIGLNQAAVAAQDATHRDVFVRGQDGALWWRSSAGGPWAGWTSLGGLTPSGPAAVSWGPGRIDVFVRGMDNGLWHRGWTTAGGWSPWQTLGGIITSAPAVASWAANRLDVFARGGDNALWHIGWDGSNWSSWEFQGGAINADPGAVSWAPNRIDVFVRGTDNGMWHKAWTGSVWSGWEGHGGGFTSGFTASSAGPGLVTAYAIGLDGAIWRLSWNGSTWVGWTSLGGFWPQAPAAISPPGGGPVELVMAGSTTRSTERLVLGI